jgi:predicted metal-dependent phosphoesterase TrpH
VEARLTAVALCDHNTVDGLPDFLAAAEGADIAAIAGAEFSVDYGGRELHLLGLFIPCESFSKVTDLMRDVNNRKEASNVKLIESLNRAGYEISYERIKASTPSGNFNRAHIAAELTRMGYTNSVKHAFDTLLYPDAGHYTEPKRLSVWDMLDFIRDIGAVPVLAHPFLSLDENDLDLFLPKAKKRGLVGLECLYSTYDEATTNKAFELANKYELLYSGGSDFHGENKPDIALGVGKGNLVIPFEWVEKLQESSAKN